MLPGVGGGFFNDQKPQIFQVGANPGPIFVGNFNGQTDLVTVNAGSNDLTLISGFEGADSVDHARSLRAGSIRTRPSRSRPAAASRTWSSATPATACWRCSRGVRGADADVQRDNARPAQPDGAGVLGLERRPGSVLRRHRGTGSRRAGGAEPGRCEIAPLSGNCLPRPRVAQLVPLQESSLALVGTFLITTLPSSATEVNLGPAETEVAATVALSNAGPVALGQGAAAPSRVEDTGTGSDEPPAQPEPPKAGAEPPAASWQHRVLGTDEALERFDREHPDLFQPRRDEPPETNPSQGRGAIPAPAQEHTPLGQVSGDHRAELTDRAIEHLADRRVGETHQGYNHIKIGPVGFTHPTGDGDEERYDVSAALALAATVAGQFYFGCTGRGNGLRSRRRTFPRRVGETHQ